MTIGTIMIIIMIRDRDRCCRRTGNHRLGFREPGSDFGVRGADLKLQCGSSGDFGGAAQILGLAASSKRRQTPLTQCRSLVGVGNPSPLNT